MAELLLFFGLPILASGIDAVMDSNDIKKNIIDMTDAKKQIDDALEKNTTEEDIINLDQDTQNAYFQSMTKYLEIKNNLEKSLPIFYSHIRKIEIIGIIMIIVIFFLLLLKQFKLLGTLQYIIFYPIIFIYEKITGNKVKMQ